MFHHWWSHQTSDIIVSLQLKDQESMHSYELWDIFPKNDVLNRMRALLLVYTCKSWWQDSEVRLAINACYDKLKLSTNTTVLCRRTGPALAKQRALCTTLTNRSCRWHCLQGGSLCQQSNKLIRPNKSVTDSAHAQTGGRRSPKNTWSPGMGMYMKRVHPLTRNCLIKF